MHYDSAFRNPKVWPHITNTNTSTRPRVAMSALDTLHTWHTWLRWPWSRLAGAGLDRFALCAIVLCHDKLASNI